MDEVLDTLSSKNEAEVLLGLEEIEEHHNYYFSPTQLNYFIPLLNSSNIKVIEVCITTIYKHLGKNIKVSNKKELIPKIRNKLQLIKNNFPNSDHIYEKSIQILGAYGDKKLIELLTKDIKELIKTKENNKKDKKQEQKISEKLIENSYCAHYTAELIYFQTKELFKYQKKLINENRKEEAEFIKLIRKKVRNNYSPSK